MEKATQLHAKMDFDGEVEDYALLITSPLSYSWSPPTNLNSTVALSPDCSATANTNYELTVSTNNGCNTTDNISVTG
jgi:hypothetical protein